MRIAARFERAEQVDPDGARRSQGSWVWARYGDRYDRSGGDVQHARLGLCNSAKRRCEVLVVEHRDRASEGAGSERHASACCRRRFRISATLRRAQVAYALEAERPRHQLTEFVGADVSGRAYTFAVARADIVHPTGQARPTQTIAEGHKIAALLVGGQRIGP